MAEKGMGLAQLNAAILLEKVLVFDNNHAALSHIARQQGDPSFDINKHLAYKFYTLAEKDDVT